MASVLGAVQAAPPPDVVIASPEQVQAFSDSEAFVFSGQTLSVQSSFATERDIMLERLAPVVVGPGVRFELQGKVSSSGLPLGAPLEKRGPGSLVLSGENRYTSNTVLREGTLHLKGASALGDSLYSLEQHGGTVLKLDADARLENFIQLVESRPEDTALPGLDGKVHWRVDAGIATLDNYINATLPVHKTGEGGLRLSGVLQGHSELFVEVGMLAVDGVAAAKVAVGDGARLEGLGELAHLRVHAGGMVAPGGRDRPATLSVWGNAVFEPDSLYHVNAYPDGEADLLRVSGQAVLDGRVLAQAGEGEWADENRYLILSADAGLGDSVFAGVETDLAFLDPALAYDEHNVYLTLHRNDRQPADVAETPEEQDVGDALTPPDRPRRPRPPRPPRPPRDKQPAVPVAPTPEVENPGGPEPEQPVPETPRPTLPEPKAPEPKAPEPKAPEPKAPEPEAPQPKNPEPKKPEPVTPEPEAPEPALPEPEVPPRTDAEPQLPGTNTPEREVLEQETSVAEIPAPEIQEPNLPDVDAPGPAVAQEESGAQRPESDVVTLPPLSPLEEAMLGMSVEQLRSLLRQSSGGWHASVRSFLLEDSRHVRQALLASGREPWRSPGATHPWSKQGMEGLHDSAPQLGTMGDWRSWAQVYSANGRRRAIGAVVSDSHDSHGIVLGLDAPAAHHWRWGLAMAAQQAKLRQAGGQAQAKMDSLHAGLSAHADWNGLRVTTALLRSWHRIDSRRRVSAGPLQELQRAAYAGRSWQAVLELAPHLRSLQQWGEWLRSGLKHAAAQATEHVGPSQREQRYWRMGPYLRYEWQRLSLPGYQETGGLTAHDVAASSSALHATTLGWRVRHDWQGAGRPSWLEADLGWRRSWGSAGISSRQRFVAGGVAGQPSATFRSEGQPLTRNAVSLTLEAGLAPRRNTWLALRYSGLLGSAYRDHAAWADLRWAF